MPKTVAKNVVVPPFVPAADEPAGLYVHVPFCSAICPYCDFAVRKSNPAELAEFPRLLEQELDLWSPCAARFDTIYFGGGTPSALAPAALAGLPHALARRLRFDSPWIALEANPEDVDPERLRGWRDLGVSFLSLGVQALDDQALRFLGRRHSARDAERSIALALDAGFDCVSVDLMFALPGQLETQWRRTLERVAALRPQHISCYELTFHAGTPFGRALARGSVRQPTEEQRAALFEWSHRVLAEYGYEGYEVSNWSRAPRWRSRHNQKYWRHAPYLGIGPSAHSFDGVRRFHNLPGLPQWRAAVLAGASPIAGCEELTKAQLRLEALMLGLRLADGIDRAAFHRRFGVALDATVPALAVLVERGLLVLEPDRLVPTLRGRALADRLAVELDVALA